MWQSVDGYIYGVTFIEVADDSVVVNDAAVNGGDKLNRDTVELAIDNLVFLCWIPISVFLKNNITVYEGLSLLAVNMILSVSVKSTSQAPNTE